MEALMREALRTAREGMEQGELPIGAILATGDFRVIARGFNELNRSRNKTSHAEMVTFANAAVKPSHEAPDLILVSTLEPCVMCLGAAMEAMVDTIIYGLRAPADSGTNRVHPMESPGIRMPRIVGGIFAKECRDLFEQWLALPARNPQQRAFVEQLLALTQEDKDTN
jgi:tRNA(adenine34) deaminase